MLHLATTFTSSLARRRMTASALRFKTTLGILQETFDPWERRAPLAPSHVKELLDEHGHADLDILVQPCRKRIFSDHQYQQAGAIIQQDLSQAQVLLSVKRPKHVDSLPSNTTCIMFSHTIKGQPENMDLLQACLSRNVQLLDWERVMDESSPKKRLVSFGRHAGLAGAMDTLNGLGRKLLYSHQIATPLLQCPPAYMYGSVDQAMARISDIGRKLTESLHRPLVIAVTGRGGCVHDGVMDILQLLPHKLVLVDDLPHAATENKVYLVQAGLADVMQRTDGAPFDRIDFQNNPSMYRSAFHQKVAPHVDAIVNCVYWDSRFPRLLTKKQMKRLTQDQAESSRLLLVSDISCDVQGSIEFLEKTTTIERPFFQYDPVQEKVFSEEMTADGISVMGVPILPTELPFDSTLHFGQAAMGVVNEIVRARDQQSERVCGVDSNLLRKGLASACITTADGSLAHRYRYLESLMGRTHMKNNAVEATNSMTLLLRGHLFDSGLINQVMDVIERSKASLVVEQLLFCQQSADGKSSKSSVLLKITTPDPTSSKLIYAKVLALATAVEPAAAKLSLVDPGGVTRHPAIVEEVTRLKRVLVLGAGRVSKSLVDYLGRSENIRITVASDNEKDALEASLLAKNGRHATLDVANDVRHVYDLVKDSDLVVSLLPAPMHPRIAEECILHQSDLVTASYESDQIRQLHSRATDAGIIILNEVGLDPGLDHMSAMQIIDDIKGRGGAVTLFSSVCGGLPSPEAANNPFNYKFSWSPRGAIRACLNNAKYRRGGRVSEIPGWELLQSSAPFIDAFFDLDLEVLPNRDSLAYATVYGLENTDSIFRGTLRYKGFSSLMNVLKNVGLFSDQIEVAGPWEQVFDTLRNNRGGFESLQDFFVACADENVSEAQRAMAALKWLGILGSKASVCRKSNVVDAFCHELEKKLTFSRDEHDMIAMHHTVEAVFADGQHERHCSSLLLFGDSTHSAMAKTVGFTAAACANLILGGHLRSKRGLLLPTDCKVYDPILATLEKEGIVFKNQVVKQPIIETEAACTQ